MAKVKYPLFSGDVQGAFGKRMIFTRGGVVRRYFRPRDPKSAAQLAVREAFKDFVMPGLTQEQADLLYAAIGHLHDDRYSLISHLHIFEDVISHHGQGVTIPAGETRYLVPDWPGLIPNAFNAFWPASGTLKKLYVRLSTAQPASGSLVITVQRNSADSGVGITVPAGGSSGSKSDLVNTSSFSAGDGIRFKLVNNATANSAGIGSVTVALGQITE